MSLEKSPDNSLIDPLVPESVGPVESGTEPKLLLGKEKITSEDLAQIKDELDILRQTSGQEFALVSRLLALKQAGIKMKPAIKAIDAEILLAGLDRARKDYSPLRYAHYAMYLKEYGVEVPLSDSDRQAMLQAYLEVKNGSFQESQFAYYLKELGLDVFEVETFRNLGIAVDNIEIGFDREGMGNKARELIKDAQQKDDHAALARHLGRLDRLGVVYDKELYQTKLRPLLESNLNQDVRQQKWLDFARLAGTYQQLFPDRGLQETEVAGLTNQYQTLRAEAQQDTTKSPNRWTAFIEMASYLATLRAADPSTEESIPVLSLADEEATPEGMVSRIPELEPAINETAATVIRPAGVTPPASVITEAVSPVLENPVVAEKTEPVKISAGPRTEAESEAVLEELWRLNRNMEDDDRKGAVAVINATLKLRDWNLGVMAIERYGHYLPPKQVTSWANILMNWSLDDYQDGHDSSDEEIKSRPFPPLSDILNNLRRLRTFVSQSPETPEKIVSYALKYENNPELAAEVLKEFKDSFTEDRWESWQKNLRERRSRTKRQQKQSRRPKTPAV